MPITEQPRPTASLAQGDILSGIVLFVTKDGWNEKGGEAGRAAAKMCLVLSRPCVVAHKKHLIVAAIEKLGDKVPRDIEHFEAVLDFLTDLRDGAKAPDLFYLGQLPGQKGRFVVRLDSLHSVEIPFEPEARQHFLEQRRVATLHPDFARDLHVRLFNAFASLGFDDHNWLSTEDLEWLVTQGKADRTHAEHTVLELEALKSSRVAEGLAFTETDLINARKKLDALRDQIEPFERELIRRTNT